MSAGLVVGRVVEWLGSYGTQSGVGPGVRGNTGTRPVIGGDM